MSDKTNEWMLYFGKGALLLIAGLLVIKIVLWLLRKYMKKTDRVDPSLYKFIGNLVKVVLLVILLIMVLGYFDIKTTGIITVLGVVGGALALAMKDSIANVAGGFLLLIIKPFVQDDYVDIDGVTGCVHHIDLLVTTLTTADNKVVTIPNGKVNNAVITNYSRMETRRVDIAVGISVDSDAEHAIACLEQLVEETEGVLKEPPVFVGVSQRTPQAIEIDVRPWTTTADYWDVKYRLEESIQKMLRKEGISLPREKMDVYMK